MRRPASLFCAAAAAAAGPHAARAAGAPPPTCNATRRSAWTVGSGGSTFRSLNASADACCAACVAEWTCLAFVIDVGPHGNATPNCSLMGNLEQSHKSSEYRSAYFVRTSPGPVPPLPPSRGLATTVAVMGVWAGDCTSACKTAGLKCTPQGLRDFNSRVDTPGKMAAMAASLNFSCNKWHWEWDYDPDVPCVEGDPGSPGAWCYMSAPDRKDSSYDCDRPSNIPITQHKHRMCGCVSEDSSWGLLMVGVGVAALATVGGGALAAKRALAGAAPPAAGDREEEEGRALQRMRGICAGAIAPVAAVHVQRVDRGGGETPAPAAAEEVQGLVVGGMPVCELVVVVPRHLSSEEQRMVHHRAAAGLGPEAPVWDLRASPGTAPPRAHDPYAPLQDAQLQHAVLDACNSSVVPLRAGVMFTVTEDFRSSGSNMLLLEGTQGTVTQVDEDGDVRVEFLGVADPQVIARKNICKISECLDMPSTVVSATFTEDGQFFRFQQGIRLDRAQRFVILAKYRKKLPKRHRGARVTLMDDTFDDEQQTEAPAWGLEHGHGNSKAVLLSGSDSAWTARSTDGPCRLGRTESATVRT